MDKLSSFGKSVSASFTPFASRTQQYVKEQLGQAGEKTELPPDYIDLEKRIEALKQVHQKLLAVASQYSKESYDYPPNIRESFNDLGRTVSEKASLLSQAGSAADVQAALTAPPQARPQPKTFNHALARASLAGSQLLNASAGSQGGASAAAASASAREDPLATALEKYAIAQEKVGDARLAQDQAIQQRFLAGWNATINSNLKAAAKARTAVENARLNLDATKARIGVKEESMTEEQRIEIEHKEDEFVGQTEEAVGIMKNVLDTPEPLRNLADLITAQLEFHKKAYEILQDLAPAVDQLQIEQEAGYRKGRGE